MFDLLTLQDALLPSRHLRVAASLICGILAGICVSPLFDIAIASALIVLIAVSWIAMARWKTRLGLRTNSYFPMRADNPSAPWTSSWSYTWAGAGLSILVYAALTIGTAISDATIGWIWAVFIGTATTAALLTWAVRNNQAPPGHTSLRSLIHANTTLPHSDADRVGVVLYAAMAVPDGRQMTHASLTNAIHGCELGRAMNATAINSAIADLVAQGIAATVIERDRSGRPISWISLTKKGSEHVVELLRAP